MTDPHAAFTQTLTAALRPCAIPLTDAQLALLWRHFTAVRQANEQFNLTRITDPVDAAIRHYADSLILAVWACEHAVTARTVLDVGTGAGFPAVPLAVARPDWVITAIDSTTKKTAFLARWAREENLVNLTVLHARAEHWSDAPRFDLVAFRATGSLARCLTQARNPVAPGGAVVCFKSRPLPPEERTQADRVVRSAGFLPRPPFEYDLPCRGDVLKRQLIVHRRG